MKKADAIEIALNYSFAIESHQPDTTENVAAQEYENGTWKVELTSDITVYVNANGDASYFNNW